MSAGLTTTTVDKSNESRLTYSCCTLCRQPLASLAGPERRKVEKAKEILPLQEIMREQEKASTAERARRNARAVGADVGRVLIVSKEGSASSAETKTALLSDIVKSGARLEGVYAGKDGRVIIRGENKAELDKLKLEGYTVREPVTVHPKMCIYDVPEGVANDE